MRKPPADPHVLDVPDDFVSCTTASRPPFPIPISQRSLGFKIGDLSRVVDGTYYPNSLEYGIGMWVWLRVLRTEDAEEREEVETRGLRGWRPLEEKRK